MAKSTAPEAGSEQKVMTKYDRKMEERRIQKEKDKKQEKLTKTIVSLIGIVLVVAIVISAIRPIVAKQMALNGTYIQIGDHKISKLEYDYYYHTQLRNNANMLSYYGLDVNADLSSYMISDQMSFKDMYDGMAVEQMREVKAMADEAKKNGFSYDAETEYKAYMDSMEEFTQGQEINMSEYYKESYGPYATVSNIAPFDKEGMLASAYYQELLEQNKPSQEEVKAYYEEHKTDYDQVDYRSYIFTTGLNADASEDEIAKAVEKNKADAQAMVKSRKEGADFNELCLTYAPEESKENYEDAENDYSLSEGRYRSSLATIMGDWLYDDARKQGDIEVLEDTDSNRYYVIEFINKYYDEENNAKISDTIADAAVSEHVDELLKGYEVSDPKGNLPYLTIGNEDDASENVNADENGEATTTEEKEE